jgi:hypothetical protein
MRPPKPRPLRGGEMDGVERFFAALTVAGCVSLFAALAWMIFSGI